MVFALLNLLQSLHTAMIEDDVYIRQRLIFPGKPNVVII